ncbi:putative alpha/beta hydrolase family protein DUF2235 [Luteimonas cucumeris]|uniref:Putative alpha/beta hydrolase family protein DUF2235 n=2 Tax=Luteimonas cucumeris TaxID=985012 RepID=A0A562LAT1_9GAMM|nr:putative alpha/beta hydrolase family protein DUF2235 [Luteimonas cucumeris]
MNTPQDQVIGPRVRAVENMVARARAKTRGQHERPACNTCHIPLWLSFFFDGTGNNRHTDFPRSHSNVAALFQAHHRDQDTGIIPHYYEGLGTDFEFKDHLSRKTIHTRGGLPVHVDVHGYKEDSWLENKMGLAVGDGVDIRLEKAMFDFEDSIERTRARMRVDEINVAAFGFSRGATEARAFMHWLAAHSKVTRSGSRLKFDGIPLNVKFLGIFDTVESIGGAGKNTRPRLIRTSVPSYVEKCFHSTAAHELRDAFPLTCLGTNRYVQAVVPGAHADVGGGYDSDDQGRSNKLSRLNLLQMLDHARGAGLKLLSLAEMQASPRWKAELAHSFDVPAEIHEAHSQYMRHVSHASGTLQEVMSAHMRLYWAWIDSGLAMQDADEKRVRIHAKGRSRTETDKQLIVMQHLLRHRARTAQGRLGSQARNADFLPETVAPEVEHFFEKYVHDSFEHFSVSGGTMQMDASIADYYAIRNVLSPQA